MDGYPKTATCVCGALSVSVTQPPLSTHACSCLDCQRRSGSAFTYTAFFADAAAAVSGKYRSFRRSSDAKRFHDLNFCPNCGCAVFYRLQALPGAIGIPVGCFADPAFEKPQTLYWSMRRHQWVVVPDGSTTVERQ